MRAWGNNTDRLLDALRTMGPLTMAQLCKHLELDKGIVSPILCRLKKTAGGPRSAPKRVYITRWVSGLPGMKNHLRPVFAIGSLPDAPKPAPKPKWQTNADYLATLKVRARAAMGLPPAAVVSRQSSHGLPATEHPPGTGPAREAPAEAAEAA